MSRIGNSEWGKRSIIDDDYSSKEDESSPLDDDYKRQPIPLEKVRKILPQLRRQNGRKTGGKTMRPNPPSIPHSISRYAYAELRAFCRQYGEKKSRAAALAGVSSPILTGMPHGSDISDPVTRAVERRERLLADCAMIERAAELAGGGGFYHALILNCCHGIGYLYMDPTILPTANRNAFFKARREFYWLLHQIRSGEI